MVERSGSGYRIFVMGAESVERYVLLVVGKVFLARPLGLVSVDVRGLVPEV
jgi:hypothetical protein